MTTEREQLELAAKACGYELQWESDGTIQNRINRPTIPYECQGMISATDWNPLKDDGDCARMEAALYICVEWGQSIVQSRAAFAPPLLTSLSKYADHNGDKNAARRAASVAIAAEIGRLM